MSKNDLSQKSSIAIQIGKYTSLVSLVILSFLSYKEAITCPTIPSGMCGVATGLYNFPMSMILGSLLQSLPFLVQVIFIVIASSLFWGCIGILIGIFVEIGYDKKRKH